MKIGVTLRNMGPQSSPETMLAGARRAEALGFESIWITDHIAIPPDDAEGSGGRYTDPLTTLAWLAGATDTIKLGVGVLIAPYRPPLPTAKAIATLQELSGERLLLGVGIGWMDAEFQALGVDRHQRGRLTDAFLGVLDDCFGNEVVTLNDQPFIFAPRPTAPATYIGGSAPHALARALRFGHGWIPMATSADQLAADLATFAAMAGDAGTTPGPVTAYTGLALSNASSASDQLAAFNDLGLERLVCAVRYETLEDYLARLDVLAALRDAHG